MAKLKIQTIDEQIEEAKAAAASALEKQINQIKKSAELDDARWNLKQKIKNEYNKLTNNQNQETKELNNKHNKEHKELLKDIEGYKVDFKDEFGVPFEEERIIEKIKPAIQVKVAAIKDKGYTVKDGTTINPKGEPVKSTIVYKDDKGDKQTLKASTFAANFK